MFGKNYYKMFFWILGPSILGFPIIEYDFRQFSRPFLVLLIISLHKLQKPLCSVIGVPSGSVIKSSPSHQSGSKLHRFLLI
jgi:hypothetical protein